MNQEHPQNNESQRAINARCHGMVKKDQGWKMANRFYNKKVTGNNKEKNKCLITGWQEEGRWKIFTPISRNLKEKGKRKTLW